MASGRPSKRLGRQPWVESTLYLGREWDQHGEGMVGESLEKGSDFESRLKLWVEGGAVLYRNSTWTSLG